MNYIEITLTKCKILLTEKELVGLLCKDVELYKESLQRGKAFSRTMKQKQREIKKYKKLEDAEVEKNLH